ncbi:MAG: hypothetical protein IJ532_05520 [Alphaproteobacteria bacterium]|nr:hypothetical protein [Alphaproteobacteria bacterium]
MKSENEYIGDDKFQKFLNHYNCETPLEVVKLRFAGAICSPNADLRPTDVISSLWEENRTPRLETKAEADLFFKFFMGLWDEMFVLVSKNKISLPRFNKKENIQELCQTRFEQIELGFVEGFWGGLDNLKIPAYIAEVADSLSRVALLYKDLAKKAQAQTNDKNIFDAVTDCDKMVDKSLSFLVENYAIPHIEELKRTIN